MEGHQRNLYLYERFNARVAGVSRDDVTTLKYWADDLGLTFPLLSNVSGWLGIIFDVLPGNQPVFDRRTVIIDKNGIVRYVRDGSPDYKDILLFLKKLNSGEITPGELRTLPSAWLLRFFCLSAKRPDRRKNLIPTNMIPPPSFEMPTRPLLTEVNTGSCLRPRRGN